jgi:hypothetical protein
MFYATNLCIFCCRYFSHFLTFHFRSTSTMSKMLTMADLELTDPRYSAAASNHKVSCHHCGQVCCCCWFRIAVCLHCFVDSCSVRSSLSLFCFVASNLFFSISILTLQFPVRLFNFPFNSSISLSTLQFPFQLFNFLSESSISILSL